MCKVEAEPVDAPPSKWLGRRGPASDPHRPQRTLTLILLAGLLLPWVVAGFEWHRIRANDARIERRNPADHAPWLIARALAERTLKNQEAIAV